MRVDPSAFQYETSLRDEPTPRGGATLAVGVAAALAWLGAVAAFAWAQRVDPAWFTLPADMLAAIAAIAVAPAVLIGFVAFAAREAARARAESERLSHLAEASLAVPSPAAASMAREISRSLREELSALDGVVRAVAGRLDAFERALKQDGGALARALGEDVRLLGAARRELKAETDAIGASVSAHVKSMQDATRLLQAESAAARDGFAGQLETFTAAAAIIGRRSSEFAAAARSAAGSSEKLDQAVAKALDALARATAMTDSAPRSAQARDEDEPPRAADAAESLGLRLSGLGAPENLIPREGADVLVRPRPRQDTRAEPRTRTLADVAEAAGVRLSEALDTNHLDAIARAAAAGPEARRAMVRTLAPGALKKLSAYLRRDAAARHAAEALRRTPAKALGDPNMSAPARRDLAAAYLLIDAALG